MSEKLGALVSSTPEGVHPIPSAKWESKWTAPRLVRETRNGDIPNGDMKMTKHILVLEVVGAVSGAIAF